MSSKPPAGHTGALWCSFDLVVLAPEMASLRILQEALDVARLALFAQHPTLVGDFVHRRDPPTLRTAHRLLCRTVDLRSAISAYVAAVEHAVRHHPDPDDAAF